MAKTLEVLQKQRRTFETTDRAAAEGDQVNIETDIVARHVERMLEFQQRNAATQKAGA